MRLTLIALLLISSLAYKQESVAGQKAQPDQEFKLKVGQEAKVEDGLRVKLVAVENESRCPKGKVCVWHGNAEVVLSVSRSEGDAQRIKLNTHLKPKEAVSQGYRINLASLDPYPNGDEQIAQDQYEATLVITEAGSNKTSSTTQKGKIKPDFSGTWRIFNARDASTTLVVLHRGATLQIIQKRFARATTSITNSLHYIDGKAHFTQETYSIEPARSGFEPRSPQRIKSVVRWQGDKLVIVRGESKREWELSADGKQLVVTEGTRKQIYQRIS